MSIQPRFVGHGETRGEVHAFAGPEWLVGVGFRCWLAGYDTGDITFWENGWNTFNRALGPARAKRAVTELACWVRATRAAAARKIEYNALDAKRFCADECTAMSLIAASQHHRCPAMQACALALTGSDTVDPVIDAANAFADALDEADYRLNQEIVAALVATGARSHAGSISVPR
ncbi:MAG: hypothetical protein QNJ62_07430 [Methyloceanibacter sp.]|nr:hypothetical protein [Methyloceanibacter sp.]